MTSVRRIEARAPAKINLFLHLTDRRPDGYHVIDSIFLFTDLADRLCVQADNALSLSVSGPFADRIEPGDENNLAMRAARRLQQAAETKEGARILLEKHIPVAAGVGGGSSDAAAALKACSLLWNTALTQERLAALALELGADIPPCLSAGPVRVGGIGERVAPLSQRPGWAVLLVNPGVAVPTAEIFRRFRGSGAAFRPVLPDGVDWTDIAWLREATGNDLERHAIAAAPAIGDVLDVMAALRGCRLARMSGSGATCFGLFETPAAAERARSEIAAAHPGWWNWAGGLQS